MLEYLFDVIVSESFRLKPGEIKRLRNGNLFSVHNFTTHTLVDFQLSIITNVFRTLVGKLNQIQLWRMQPIHEFFFSFKLLRFLQTWYGENTLHESFAKTLTLQADNNCYQVIVNSIENILEHTLTVVAQFWRENNKFQWKLSKLRKIERKKNFAIPHSFQR